MYKVTSTKIEKLVVITRQVTGSVELLKRGNFRLIPGQKYIINTLTHQTIRGKDHEFPPFVVQGNYLDKLFNEIHQKAIAGIKEHCEDWIKHFEEN